MTADQEHVKQLATRLVKRYLGAELSGIELIEGRGQVNQVYTVSTSQHKAILRVNDRDELRRYQKEQWCMDSALSVGVVVPGVSCVGIDERYAYMLLEFIPGTNGEAIADTNDTWYALGKNLRLIHSIPVAGFGDTLEAITSGNTTQWQRYITDNVHALTNKSLTGELGLTENQVNGLRNLLDDLLAKEFAFGLNHGDYSLANTIMSEGIPYVIDWGSAQAHIVPHHDLAVILEESLEEDSQRYASLLSGYQMMRQDYETIRDEIKILQLLDAIDKVRWALDKAPQRVKHHHNRFNKFMERARL